MKNKIISVPLENIESRYTIMMNDNIQKYVDLFLYPEITFNTDIETGQFLDVNKTSIFKSKQLQMISELFYENKINDGDIFFISDIFFPGIEVLRYLSELQNINIKIFAINHAGRADENDFIQKLGKWSDYSEKGYHLICDGIFVGSEHHKKNIMNYFEYPKDQIHVFGQIWDIDFIKNIYYNPDEIKEDYIIWPHRICQEKGIDDLIQIAKKVDQQIIITNSTKNPLSNDLKERLPENIIYKNGLSKKEYYEIFSKAKWYLSNAYQETFGYTIQEAILYNCNIIVPDNACIKEMVPEHNLYHNLDKVADMVRSGRDYTIPFTYTQRWNNNILNYINFLKKQ